MSNKIVIAEIGQNWVNKEGVADLDIAKTMIKEAKKCGCDMAKFQFYNPHDIYEPNDPNIKHAQETALSIHDSIELVREGEKQGIEVFFSIFSKFHMKTLLEHIPQLKTVKVASRSNRLLSMIEVANKAEKQLIISMGMNPYPFSVYRDKFGSVKKCKILMCVSEYPAPIKKYMREPVYFYDGVSDHTEGLELAQKIKIWCNLKIWEKHFILDKTIPSPDVKCSLGPTEMKEYVRILKGRRGNE